MGTQSTWGVPSKTLSEQHLLLYVCNLSTMAPNENIAVGRVLTTYKVADKAMDIPVVNDVVTGVKKMADPIAPYVEGTLKMMKGKAEESLSPEVKEKVGSTLGSLGSKIDNLACNGLDQLTTAVPSLQTATTPELMENTKEAASSVDQCDIKSSRCSQSSSCRASCRCKAGWRTLSGWISPDRDEPGFQDQYFVGLSGHAVGEDRRATGCTYHKCGERRFG